MSNVDRVWSTESKFEENEWFENWQEKEFEWLKNGIKKDSSRISNWLGLDSIFHDSKRDRLKSILRFCLNSIFGLHFRLTINGWLRPWADYLGLSGQRTIMTTIPPERQHFLRSHSTYTVIIIIVRNGHTFYCIVTPKEYRSSQRQMEIILG